MSHTQTLTPPKRPRSSPEEIFTTPSKRLNASSFELDLSLCPEVSYIDEKFSQLEIDPTKNNDDEGDEMQKAAIAHATKGGNLFLTGKAGTGKWKLKLKNV